MKKGSLFHPDFMNFTSMIKLEKEKKSFEEDACIHCTCDSICTHSKCIHGSIGLIYSFSLQPIINDVIMYFSLLSKSSYPKKKTHKSGSSMSMNNSKR